jgi:hypothetical protein
VRVAQYPSRCFSLSIVPVIALVSAGTKEFGHHKQLAITEEGSRERSREVLPRRCCRICEDKMHVRVVLHGWYTVGLENPDGCLDVDVPEGTDVAGIAQALRERSPMLDAYASLVMIGGKKVELNRVLMEGEEVHFYPVFSGG